MKVNSSTLAKQLAEKLDALDNGGKNGKIEASVWNEFVKDKGGKTVKSYINTKSAVRSLVVYLCRQAREKGRLIVELGQEWIDGLNSAQTKPAESGKTEPTGNPAQRGSQSVNGEQTNRPVDTSYSTISRERALERARNDSRLEELKGGDGWSISSDSFVTDIPYARKHTGEILSFVSSLIGEEIIVTSALGTAGTRNRRTPHVVSRNYCTHHNAENPKLDIKHNGHPSRLKYKLSCTGLFSRISIESTHLDIQIKPEVYYAFDRGYDMANILACAKNNTLGTLIA